MLKGPLHDGKRGQQGLSIVELLVGVAIGLVITAAATLLMSGQLVENRRLLTETQVQQDLRAATDIMAREMRRAGGANEGVSLESIWYPGSSRVVNNDNAQVLRVPSGTSVEFEYFPGPFPGGPSTYQNLSKFSLQGARIKTEMGGGPQDLTDANVMRVTAFAPTVSSDSSASIVLPCPNLCPDPLGGPPSGTACWPKFQVRKGTIAVEARALRDDTVKRAINSTVRLRNDNLVFFNPLTNQMCPP